VRPALDIQARSTRSGFMTRAGDGTVWARRVQDLRWWRWGPGRRSGRRQLISRQRDRETNDGVVYRCARDQGCHLVHLQLEVLEPGSGGVAELLESFLDLSVVTSYAMFGACVRPPCRA
jgi:hypothetical protein